MKTAGCQHILGRTLSAAQLTYSPTFLELEERLPHYLTISKNVNLPMWGGEVLPPPFLNKAQGKGGYILAGIKESGVGQPLYLLLPPEASVLVPRQQEQH